MMEDRTLGGLAARIREVNATNGWRSPKWHNAEAVMAQLMLITAEVAEAAEEVRMGPPHRFCEELADIIIRTLDLAEGLGLPIEEAVLEKIEKNTERGWRHGGKRI